MFSLPFGKKKKEDEGFKLDQEQLPSVGAPSDSQAPSPEQNPSPDGLAPLSQSSQPQTFPQENYGMNFPQSASPFPQEKEPQFQPVQGGNDSGAQDITKAKLESVEAKLSLSEARLSSIEQKLELLTKVIMEEVSDETKRKLNLENMRKSFK